MSFSFTFTISTRATLEEVFAAADASIAEEREKYSTGGKAFDNLYRIEKRLKSMGRRIR